MPLTWPWVSVKRAVEVCLERFQDAVGAAVAGGDEQLVEGGVAEAAHGLAVEVQTAGDGADRPALLHQAVDVLVTVAGPFDDLRAGQFRHRQFHWDRFRHRRPRLLLGVFAQAVAVLVTGLLHRGGQVLKQVPAICDFEGVGGGLLDRLRIGGGPVPADDLRTGMGLEPGRERLRGAIGQHVHDPAGLDVDQHGAVGAALAEGELVHSQHPRGTALNRRRRQQPEEPGPARGQPQATAQPCRRTAAQLHRNRPQPPRQPGARPAVPLGQARHLLDERPAGTPLPVAEVPAHPEPDDDAPQPQRPFIQASLVRTVHASRLLPAARTAARPAGGHCLHHQGAGGVADTLNSHSDPGKQHILNRLARHGRKHTAETFPRSRP